MAAYNLLKYGSSGDDVLELQRLLNKNGYTLDEDGVFGELTEDAVRDYQQKNSLDVDGVVGDLTWEALKKAMDTTTEDPGVTPDTPGDTPATPEPAFPGYTPSDAVAEAERMLDEMMNSKPGEYQSSWQSQIDDILDKIMNREKFSYDLNGDALYQQYKDQYVTQGKMAMMDTMGKAQAMTGGYGNSYAQGVGQQTYQGYLQGLNDEIPELYQLALDQYNAEGDRMYDQFAMMAQQEEQAYGRYRDEVSDWFAELQRLYEQYINERNYDYGQWADERDFEYQKERDEAADEKWLAEFEEAKRQFEESLSRSGGGGGGGSGGGGYDNMGYNTDIVKLAQEFVGAGADGKWGSESEAKAKEKGYGNLTEVVAALYKNGILGDDPGDPPGDAGFTGSTYNEAVDYLKKLGKSASGLMTQSEWQRHRNNYLNGQQSNAEGANYSSYIAYLQAFITYATQ